MGRASQRIIYGDLSKYGLPFPEMGVKSTVEEKLVAPAIDAGFVEAVKRGRIELVTTIDRFDGAEVVLSDGSRLRPDVVLCATGYRRGLDPLVGHLGVLDERGLPKNRPDVEVDGAPNLLFAGYTPRFAGSLRQIRFDARRIGRLAKRRVARA